MNLPKYQLKSNEKLTSFEFISVGKKGNISKIIQFSATNYHDVYNLSFGDKDDSTGGLNDKSISGNGDSEIVLATVISAVFAFIAKNPEAWVYATGSSNARTRLYRMGITKHLKFIKSEYVIYGQTNDSWEVFKINKEYEAFLLRKK
jgi:hypothetical protein